MIKSSSAHYPIKSSDYYESTCNDSTNTVQKRTWVLTSGVSFDQQLDSVDFTVDLSFFHNAAGKLLLPLLLNWGRAQRQAQSQFPADPKLTSSKWLLSNLLRIQLESHIGCDIKTSLVVVHLPAALDSTPAPPLVLCVTYLSYWSVTATRICAAGLAAAMGGMLPVGLSTFHKCWLI